MNSTFNTFTPPEYSDCKPDNLCPDCLAKGMTEENTRFILEPGNETYLRIHEALHSGWYTLSPDITIDQLLEELKK